MSLLFRRILYILFILGFLIITPNVILTAMGYKLKLGTSLKDAVKIQKTGILVLDSGPEGAKIYLNGVLQEKQINKTLKTLLPGIYKGENNILTPVKIKNLTPGEYNVKIYLDGYWDWEKKLVVKEGESTFAEDIKLFNNSLPQIVLREPNNFLSLSQDKKTLVSLGTSSLTAINLENEKITPLSDEKIINNKEIIWSPDNKKFIADGKIFDLVSGKLFLNLADFLPKKINNLKWGADSNNILFIEPRKDNDILYIFNLTSKEKTQILKKAKIVDYLVKNEGIYLVSLNKLNIDLEIYSLEGKLLRTINLPASPSYKFINSEENLINLMDDKHNTLYLVDLQGYLPFAGKIENIKHAYWLDSNRLFCANDYEIFIYNLTNQNKTLLTRISYPIKAIFWHPSNNYIIYATESAFNIIELDDREKRNITEILRLDKISFPYLNGTGDILYFFSKIGSQEGVYKLMLD